MTGRAPSLFAQAPDWLAAEMPPGYQTRLLEIARLTADLQSMEAVGRVLWQGGDALRDAVSAVFGALKFEVDARAGADGPLAVNLGDSRRLLLLVSRSGNAVQKTHEEVTRTFQAVQYAGAGDRVVFVAANDPAKPPGDRPSPILPDALGVLQRMGVNVVTTSTLFTLWRLSLEDHQKARKAVEHLHAQDGGVFSTH